MFKFIKFITQECDNTNGMYYLIKDTAFEIVVFMPVEINSALTTVYPEIVIIREYQARKLNVTRNLVAYYKQILNSGIYNIKNLAIWRRYIEENAPELEYSKKYYNCVLKQLKGYHYGQKNF